jgi:ABC-2 type transport system permease protein
MSALQAREAGGGGTLVSLILHAVQMRVRGTIIWGIVPGLYVLLMIAAYVSLEDQMQQFEELLATYPEAFAEAFEMSSLVTIEGFLGAEFFNVFAPLVFSFFAILALSAALAGAEERRTIDVLLSNPFPRWQLVIGSFISTAISLFFILAILGLFTWIPAALFDLDLSLSRAVETVLGLWPICIVFGALALLCSAFFHRRALAIAIPAILLFGMYFMDVIGGLVEDMEDLRYFSAFYYYGSPVQDGIDWAHFAGLVGAAVVLVVLAIPIFRLRDVYT